MIIWGGSPDGGNTYLNTGGRYDPSTDSWTATSTASAPSARGGHTAVWTGTGAALTDHAIVIVGSLKNNGLT